MESVSKSPSELRSSGRRITNIKPFSALVWMNHALLELKRVTTCAPSGNIPVDLIGFKSLSAPPERRTDFKITSAWNSKAGGTTNCSALRRIRLPLLSTAERIWINICSTEV